MSIKNGDFKLRKKLNFIIYIYVCVCARVQDAHVLTPVMCRTTKSLNQRKKVLVPFYQMLYCFYYGTLIEKTAYSSEREFSK